MKKILLVLSFVLGCASLQAQSLNFRSEYDRVTWPVAFGIGGGITGDDGQFKRIAIYHGGSISLQTGTNVPNLAYSRFNITPEGKVGIGTLTPAYLLSVCGTIQAKEVRVESGWCDFVFEPTYRLRPLREVESFIKENGHLPEVPSAAVVQKEGVGLSEATTMLLQKVEELTLYLIEQNKQIEELQQVVKTFEK